MPFAGWGKGIGMGPRGADLSLLLGARLWGGGAWTGLTPKTQSLKGLGVERVVADGCNPRWLGHGHVCLAQVGDSWRAKLSGVSAAEPSRRPKDLCDFYTQAQALPGLPLTMVLPGLGPRRGKSRNWEPCSKPPRAGGRLQECC